MGFWNTIRRLSMAEERTLRERVVQLEAAVARLQAEHVFGKEQMDRIEASIARIELNVGQLGGNWSVEEENRIRERIDSLEQKVNAQPSSR
jgi:ribosome assembly protein YihI (activator of Der GTPase)